jgi:hypothetical protein
MHLLALGAIEGGSAAATEAAVSAALRPAVLEGPIHRCLGWAAPPLVGLMLRAPLLLGFAGAQPVASGAVNGDRSGGTGEGRILYRDMRPRSSPCAARPSLC